MGSIIKCCFNCTTDRHVGCHGTCEKYIAEKVKHDERRARALKAQSAQYGARKEAQVRSHNSLRNIAKSSKK